MIKLLTSAVLTMLTAAALAKPATSVTTTQTNVLQNINLQLTIYQQGATNSDGRKVADKVTAFNTKSLITALGAVTGTNFGNGAKLVHSTIFSNVTVTIGNPIFSTVLSTNLAIPTNGYLRVGGNIFYFNPGILTISSNQMTDTNGNGYTLNSGVVSAILYAGPTNGSVTIDINSGYTTTITPSTNGASVAIVTLDQTTPAPTASILTNVSSSVAILYGGTANQIYPVDSYVSFTINSPEIVLETGVGLDTTNALTVANLASQSGFCIQNLNITYYATNGGSNNLQLNLQGFVKQALKVDLLSAHGTNRIYEDIFGANSTWNLNGSGSTGGAYTTNSSSASFPVTNASPVVVEGTLNISFLKNLAQ